VKYARARIRPGHQKKEILFVFLGHVKSTLRILKSSAILKTSFAVAVAFSKVLILQYFFLSYSMYFLGCDKIHASSHQHQLNTEKWRNKKSPDSLTPEAYEYFMKQVRAKKHKRLDKHNHPHTLYRTIDGFEHFRTERG
jgi:hypothetical protein